MDRNFSGYNKATRALVDYRGFCSHYPTGLKSNPPRGTMFVIVERDTFKGKLYDVWNITRPLYGSDVSIESNDGKLVVKYIPELEAACTIAVLEYNHLKAVES